MLYRAFWFYLEHEVRARVGGVYKHCLPGQLQGHGLHVDDVEVLRCRHMAPGRIQLRHMLHDNRSIILNEGTHLG